MEYFCLNKFKLKIILNISVLNFIIIFYFINFPKQLSILKIDAKSQKEKIVNRLIYRLNKNYYKTEKKYILLFDYIFNPYCTDKNSFIIFKSLLKKNYRGVYYVIHKNSPLYQKLVKKNKIDNIIPIDLPDGLKKLYPYLLKSKLIINSYVLLDIQKIVSKVKYLKYLFINHGISFFKKNLNVKLLQNLTISKRNIISSSPYEYKDYIELAKYNKNYIYKAGLPKYDRFKNMKIDNSDKKCILMTFTYRKYNNEVFERSLFKKNFMKLLSQNNLMEFLKKQNINFFYIPHHFDTFRKRNFSSKIHSYVKILEENKLSKKIEKCSLFITDFSSISFDFIFLNKPVLYYLIDYNDSINFEEKQYMKFDLNFPLFKENTFYDQESLIKKIMFYVKNKFKINSNLRNIYNKFFFYKRNITNRIIDIINKIIKEKPSY